ncbi:DUF2119 domain-containing protein [Methanobrevibacter sp. TMH8]|uniref:DUF2119 domain-containing protein n=1 Tax=Methanobrevibacter sp. TMH8 TaxID=2848611 RepID=UPI001CCEB310|nr:DUF2119 domain-containing protein [Methanobrevibacter sp. TMH8]MBZ9571376.1 DUF2119 domain-containing protein [Methanobrevibacter sp. TMH8]
MSYFRFINKGKGPTKLFVGGIHGNEGETTIDFFKSLIFSDFSNGKTFIYNFDNTRYISTLKKEYFDSDMGKYLIKIIKKHKPDFYTELHCYNIKNYEKLTSKDRMESQGIPPLINLENHVLISSVSPLIRKKYFQMETVCKTLEIPCIKKNSGVGENFSMDTDSANIYLNILKILAKVKNREEFQNKMVELYPKQVDLAIKYAKEIFGKYFPPF